ncbi:MAG: hypothetical protein JNL10_07825 [Verrucomicrobiales bacterium]|nr:hypothetical protein [Verrucomicrobiales bacterium]
MSKKSAPSLRPRPVKELEPAGTKYVSPERFRADLKPGSILDLLGGGLEEFSFGPIETLSPGKTLGKGRTNLTLIESTIVQVDTTPPAPPFANFDKTKSERKPAIQMHFDPAAYGFTSPQTFIMEFTLSVVGTASFNLVAGPAGVNITGVGARNLSGNVRVSIVFHRLSPGQQVFGFIEQTSGGVWTWFQTQIKLPPLVLSR